MPRFFSYVNTVEIILDKYNGQMPFSAFLKNFFSADKKYGSRDRKIIASLCYNYYRTGFAAKHKNTEEVLIISSWLCNHSSNEFLQIKKPEWNDRIELPLMEKISQAGIDVLTIFPFNEDLSGGTEVTAFNTSFLIQPNLFIRIRPGNSVTVRQKLLKAQTAFTEISENCFSFKNGTKLEQVLDINKEAVVQDFNSQRVGEMLKLTGMKKDSAIWDCCAASGGKSIMAYDLLPGISLTVSDVRPTIINNLQQRLGEAGINNYHSFTADITQRKSVQSVLKNEKFDLIMCDAPCSGSGTWSRTPEQLTYFKHTEINCYSNLQKAIVANAALHLKKSGYFLYITCSVLKQENEEVVEYIQHHTNLTLLKMELLKGYEIKADTMFAALFRSSALD